MLTDDAVNIWYFSYYSYVQFLTSEHMIKIDNTGMKTCVTLIKRYIIFAYLCNNRLGQQ